MRTYAEASPRAGLFCYNEQYMVKVEPKFIDIHSHLQFVAFDEDREAVIKRTVESGTWVINVGTQYDTSKNAVDLAHTVPEGFFATIGLHPIHTSKSYHDKQELGDGGQEFTSRGETFDYDKYLNLGRDPKVVGVGECGLDYYRLDENTKQKQKEVFEAQIALANELKKPLMLHIRNGQGQTSSNAYLDAYEILKSQAKVSGDIHFFAGNWEEAKKFLDIGFSLSFTGAITFPRKENSPHPDYASVIKKTPLDMIMTETDCPYLAPVPHRGKKNEPAFVEFVIKEIAKIKGLPTEVVSAQIFENAKKLFSL